MPVFSQINRLSILFLSLSSSLFSISVWATDPSASSKNHKVDALIYAGDATAFGDSEAITSILESRHLTAKAVSSEELNQMTLEDLSQYGMIIWPGGYAGQMSDSLKSSTRELIRRAVVEQGVSYVGICAGAFIAVSPPAEPNSAGPKWGLALFANPTDPKSLLPYYHLEDEGVEDAMVNLKMYDGTTQSQVWWGGPTLPEIPNGVIARYSDNNQPAVVQTTAGKGFVILSGPHPEAPEDWRTKLDLQDSDGLDQNTAATLFEAALKQQPLPTVS